MKTICLIFLILTFTSTVHAGSNVEAQKSNAFLTLSAFECAVLSPNQKETERLFTLGLKAGRDFIQFVHVDSVLYQKSIKSQVPMLWNLMGGPTADFILGRIYADREQEIYKEFSPDEKLWIIKKQRLYQAKNCALLGEK